jgi:MoxR-like ATPase
MEGVPALLKHVRGELARVVVGQEEMLDQCLVALLCRGHALVEGVPGIAKTLAVKTLARLLTLSFQRVQATSDLMPADIVGTNVLNLATSTFQLHRGPVFTDFLLVDEVNRMPPRTQAALLECMEERQVTIDGTRHQLSPAFTVFATQNPVEFEGTYPLPEAQLDRFLIEIRAQYPTASDEVQLLARAQAGFDSRTIDGMALCPVECEVLARAQQEVREVKVQETLFSYIVQVARRTREWPSLALGASPRASLALLTVSKAIAALDSRDYLIPDDVKASVGPVLRHRVLLKPEADLEGLTAAHVLEEVVRAVEVPR